MENLNLKESLSSIFQKDWWKKYLGLFGIYILLHAVLIISLLLITTGVMTKNIAAIIIFGIIGVCLIIASIIAMLVANVYINGYFILYSNDIAHNKNALFRPVFSKDTFKKGLLAGAKGLVFGIITIPFIMFLAFPVFITAATLIKNAFIAIFISFIILFFPFAILATKIFAYFIKDMDVLAFFHWGKAFKFSKGVKDTLWVAILTIIANSLSVGLYMGLSYLLSTKSTILFNLLQILASFTFEFVSIILCAFLFNLLGQYTYAAINKNQENEPEGTVPSPKTGNIGPTIIIIVALIFTSIPIIGIVTALTIPTLVNRQSNLTAKVKMKKAIAAYENVTAIYMIENSKGKEPLKNLKGFTGNYCEKLGNYFRIVESDTSCGFTTEDGVHWDFNSDDGSAVIEDNITNPTYKIKVGVCKDGTINCPEEYPDVSKFFNS